MTTLVEGRHPGEFIISEANGERSREAVVIAAEQTITPGTVLALDGGEYARLDPADSGGFDSASAIAIYGTTTGVGETKTIAVLARDAEVNAAELDWGDANAGQITTATGQLAAVGIILRAA